MSANWRCVDRCASGLCLRNGVADELDPLEALARSARCEEELATRRNPHGEDVLPKVKGHPEAVPMPRIRGALGAYERNGVSSWGVERFFCPLHLERAQDWVAALTEEEHKPPRQSSAEQRSKSCPTL